jgi:hypothetical protein
MYRLCVAVVFLAAASGIVVGDGKQKTEKAAYVGTLADDSTLTLEVMGTNLKFQFSNKWSVGKVQASVRDQVTDFAGTGKAGDKSLTVTGKVQPDKAEIEIQVGVGKAAQKNKYTLKKK